MYALTIKSPNASVNGFLLHAVSYSVRLPLVQNPLQRQQVLLVSSLRVVVRVYCYRLVARKGQSKPEVIGAMRFLPVLLP